MGNQAAQGLLSPFLQHERLKAARPHLHGRVLDVGCGNGALARNCDRAGYYGFDVDAETVAVARKGAPGYEFHQVMPEASRRFDTVAALALIEHLSDPRQALLQWADRLDHGGRIVLTTPLPSLEWAHELGAKVGLFSHDASEEHESLLDLPAMTALIAGTNLKVDAYARFLGGANQLFLLSAHRG